MREATHKTTVRVAADILWDYLADYSNLLRLASAEATSELLDGQAGVLGARYAGTMPWHGLKSTFEVELTEAEWPERITWTSHSPGAICTVALHIERSDIAQSLVTATVSYEACAASTPLEPFAWGLLDRLYQSTMERLSNLTLPAKGD